MEADYELQEEEGSKQGISWADISGLSVTAVEPIRMPLHKLSLRSTVYGNSIQKSLHALRTIRNSVSNAHPYEMSGLRIIGDSINTIYV